MELEASRALPADRDTVRRSLDDPEALERRIPAAPRPVT
jgi:carbon monoxide dehydrogenase subunit G